MNHKSLLAEDFLKVLITNLSGRAGHVIEPCPKLNAQIVKILQSIDASHPFLGDPAAELDFTHEAPRFIGHPEYAKLIHSLVKLVDSHKIQVKPAV